MAKALGKGLGALIKTYNSDVKKTYENYNLDITKIVPNSNQPRQEFDKKSMVDLIESINEKGILQPLAVRKISDDSYELIAGERRLRAAQSIGLKTVPAFIIKVENESEMMELALIENIQRDNLNSIEEAEGYAILSGKFNFTQNEIAKKVSKSRSEIANKLRLLKLPPLIQQSLRNNEINYGHARALLGFRESTIMLKIFKKIISKKLNVRQTELFIKSIKSPTKIISSQKKYTKLEKELTNYFNTNLTIKKFTNTGQIIIKFANEAELERIISLMMKN